MYRKIRTDLLNEEYHRLPSWSPSRMAKIHSSGSVYHALQPVEQTESMLVGNIAHAYLAGEPVVVLPSGAGDSAPPDTVPQIRAAIELETGEKPPTKLNKMQLVELAAEHGIVTLDQARQNARDQAPAGAIICTDIQSRFGKALARVVREACDLQELGWLHSAGVAEGFVEGELGGLPVRCRPDRLVWTDRGWLVVSWKTTAAGRASPSEWRKRYRWDGYGVADAAYIAIVEAALGAPCVGVIGVAVETVGVARYDWTRPTTDAALVFQMTAGSESHARHAADLDIVLARIREYEETQQSGYMSGILEV